MQSSVESVSRQRNPRACENCRLSKTKCHPSEDGNICQRCTKGNFRCVFSTEPRTRRARRTAAQILADSRKPVQEDTSAFRITLPKLPYPSTIDACVALQSHHVERFKRHISNISNKMDTQGVCEPLMSKICPYPSPESATRNESPVPKTEMEERYITIDQATNLLHRFRDKSYLFPFVVIPPEATVQCLARDSPFLLLAILTAASNTDMKLQYQLDHELKRVLSTQVVVEGKKSLDFLQGILVYLAWYPTHLKPKNNQALMYIRLASSIANDLGVDQVYASPIPRLDGLDIKGLFEGESFSKPAQRAYLGCYYLSASLSVGFLRPNSFAFDDTMETFGHLLARDPEFPSDTTLLPLIQSQHIAESVRASIPTRQTSLPRKQFQPEEHSQMFEATIEEWRKSLPEDVKALPHIGLTDRWMCMITYSFNIGSTLNNKNTPPNWRVKRETMARCLETCKKYFEFMLSIPEKHYSNFTTVQWGNLVFAIVILSKLSFPINICDDWDHRAARQYAPLTMYLDCLCYRFRNLSPPESASIESFQHGDEHPDTLVIFRLVLESVKHTFEERVIRMDNTPFTNQIPAVFGCETWNEGFCPMLDAEVVNYLDRPVSALSTPNGSMETDTEHKGSTIPIYHDLWATMTMSWAD